MRKVITVYSMLNCTYLSTYFYEFLFTSVVDAGVLERVIYAHLLFLHHQAYHATAHDLDGRVGFDLHHTYHTLLLGVPSLTGTVNTAALLIWRGKRAVLTWITGYYLGFRNRVPKIGNYKILRRPNI